MARMPALFVWPRKPDEHPREQWLHEGLARYGRGTAQAACSAGHLCPLVLRGDRSHGHATAPHDSRLLRLPPGAVRLSLSGTRRSRGRGRNHRGAQADLVRTRPRSVGTRSWHMERAGPPLPEGGRACRPIIDQRLKPLDYHFELGLKLASLREHGIMVLGSGNVVHNLRRIQWKCPDAALPWAERFDDAWRSSCPKLQTRFLGWLSTPIMQPPFRPPTTSSRCSISPAWPRNRERTWTRWCGVTRWRRFR